MARARGPARRLLDPKTRGTAVQRWTVHASNMLAEAQVWINAHYPYWARKGGRDHIWVRLRGKGEAPRRGAGRTACVARTQLRGKGRWINARLDSCHAIAPEEPCPHDPVGQVCGSLLLAHLPQLNVHDEGSCWMPTSIKNSIILSHWGRHDTNHSSYGNASTCTAREVPGLGPGGK